MLKELSKSYRPEFSSLKLAVMLCSPILFHSCSCNNGMSFNKGGYEDALIAEGNESLEGETEADHSKEKLCSTEVKSLVKGLVKLVDNDDKSDTASTTSSDNEESSPSECYWELINLAKQRKSLEGKWMTYNRPLMKGFELSEELGVMSARDEFFLRHTNMIALIDRVDSFESLVKHKEAEFERGEITKEEFETTFEGLSEYAISLTMIKAMLETKLPDGRLKYVEDGREYHKPRLRKPTAEFLSEKANKFFCSVEKMGKGMTEDTKTLASPENFVKCKTKLMKVSKLTGLHRLNIDLFDPETHPIAYKKELIPGSLSWTWVNSKSLREGSWSSLLRFKNKEERILNILRDLDEASAMYMEFMPFCEKILREGNHNTVEKRVLESFEELKKDSKFSEKYEKGKRSIKLLREILAKRVDCEIGRGGVTIGLKYVGKWRPNSKHKQISTEHGEELTDILDILSGFYVFLGSEGMVKPSLYHNRVIRSVLSKTKLWVCETPEEQSKREAKTRNIRNSLMALMLVITGLSAFFPPLLGVSALLFAVKVILGIVVIT